MYSITFLKSCFIAENLSKIIIYSEWHKNWNLITLIQRHTCFVDISFICLYWCVLVVQSLEYCIMDFQRFQFFTAWGRTKRFCRHFAISNGLIPLHTYIKFIIYHIIECKGTQCNKMLILNTSPSSVASFWCCQAFLILVWWCYDGLVRWSFRHKFILLFKSFIGYKNYSFHFLQRFGLSSFGHS